MSNSKSKNELKYSKDNVERALEMMQVSQKATQDSYIRHLSIQMPSDTKWRPDLAERLIKQLTSELKYFGLRIEIGTVPELP